jgi:uncharacterized membrane protein YedE/YeeE
MMPFAPLLVGFAFGWVLQKGKLGRYETIVNVFRLTDLTVVKFLVTGLLVAALGIQSLSALGLAVDLPVPQTFVLGNLVGGIVFGAGMALAGFCPGTVAAGAGEGRLDYLFAGSAGLVTGALVFGALYSRLYRAMSIASVGAVTLPQLTGLDAWLLVILFWEMGLLLFYGLERGGSRARATAPRSSP